MGFHSSGIRRPVKWAVSDDRKTHWRCQFSRLYSVAGRWIEFRYGSEVEQWRVESRNTGWPAPVPHCPPQIPHELSWDSNWPPRWGAWAVASPMSLPSNAQSKSKNQVQLSPTAGAEKFYSSFGVGAWWGVGGQRHAPAALPPGKRDSTQCTGGWMCPRAGLDWCGKSRPYRDSNPGLSRPSSARFLTQFRPLIKQHVSYAPYRLRRLQT